MDRYWLLTWTTYGSWLPGDDRGFVSNVRNGEGPEVRFNIPGTPTKANMPGLEDYARRKMKGTEIRLQSEQASILISQFQETATCRGWQLLAAAVMSNHCHAVVGVPGDPDPSTLLRDFKSYGSRALNQHWPKSESGRWWTESGSRRKLPNDTSVLSAIKYVFDQEYPLCIWTAPIPELDLLGGKFDVEKK